MAASKKLITYLDKGGIKYEVVPHKKVYTAYDLANTLGHSLDAIAKPLLVKAELPKISKEGQYFIVVVPASYRANLGKVKKALKAASVKLAPEKIFKKLQIEPGALTPFGGYHKMGVLLDKALLKAKNILVSAESYTEALRVKAEDLHRVENMTLGQFGDKSKAKIQKIIKKVAKVASKAQRAAKKAKYQAKVKKLAKRVAKAAKKKKR